MQARSLIPAPGTRIQPVVGEKCPLSFDLGSALLHCANRLSGSQITEQEAELVGAVLAHSPVGYYIRHLRTLHSMKRHSVFLLVVTMAQRRRLKLSPREPDGLSFSLLGF